MEHYELGVSAGSERHAAVDAAPLWKRVAARAIDTVVGVVLGALLLHYCGLAGQGQWGWIILAPWLYMVLSQAVTRNTIGKYLMGVQVVSMITTRPSLGKLAVREALGPIGGIVGWIFAFRAAQEDPNRQTWADTFADTCVVNRQAKPVVQVGLVVLIIATWLLARVVVMPDVHKWQEAQNLQVEINQTAAELDRMAPRLQEFSTALMRRTTQAQARETSKEMLPLIGQYDLKLSKLKSLLQQALDQNLVKPDRADVIRRMLAMCNARLIMAGSLRKGLEALEGMGVIPPGTGQNIGNFRDASYRITADSTGQMGDPGPAYVVRIPAAGWTRLPRVQWIGPSNNQSNAKRNPCCRNTSDTYQTKFTLDPAAVTETAFEVTVAADDYVDVLLNGKPVWSHTSQNMCGAPQKFTVKSGFQLGENTLTFVVTNLGGPTGLLASLAPVKK
ncbi:MAG TPA: RDD family protein [Verrucomicrobiae bacterium]|nr:RDD family protein [Verrucomicrobiae bacterium]